MTPQLKSDTVRGPPHAGKLLSLSQGCHRLWTRLYSIKENYPDLLVLHVDEVVCDGACAGRLLGEGEEAEPPALLLLLVVHDDHLDDFAVAGKEGPEVRLRDAGRQAAEEHLLRGRILIDTPMRDELLLRLEVIHR